MAVPQSQPEQNEPPPPHFPLRLWLGLACPMVTGVVAIVFLWMWWTGHWQWAVFGNIVPMAPSTALAFVLLSVALGLQRLWATRPVARGLALLAAGITAAAALDVVIRSLTTGDTPGWENWLGHVDATVRGSQVGHMSPYTAGLFLLSAFSLATLSLTLTSRARLREAGLGAAFLGGFAALPIVLSYVAGTPLIFNSERVPIAPATALLFMVLNLGLLLAGRGEVWLHRLFFGSDAATAGPVRAKREEYFAAALMLMTLLAVVSGGHFYLRIQQRIHRKLILHELTAIADLKVNQITQWREERDGDARILQRTPLLGQNLAALAAADPGSAALRAELRDWMQRFVDSHRYKAIILLDCSMQPLLAVPGSAEASGPRLREWLRTIPAGDEVAQSEFYRDEPGGLCLDLFVPLRAGDGAAEPGGVLLRIDPGRFLFPFLQTWPYRSATAETLMLQREGDSLLYLNELRHQSDAALKLRRSLTAESGLLGARTVRGETGAMEGVDYRGVPVLGVGRPVPGTSWFIVAKIDREEIYAPLREEAWKVGWKVAAILFAIALGMSLAWRRRRDEILQRQWTAERERAKLHERLALVMRHANDAILLLDQNLRVVESNERVSLLYGYTENELLQLTVRDFRAPEGQARLAADLAGYRTPAGATLETVHRRKDGTIFPVEVSGRWVEIGSRPHLLAIIRDISERKAHERQIERLTRLYLGLGQVSQAIVRIQTPSELMDTICRILVEQGRFKMAWIGWYEPATREIRAAAKFGDPAGYPETLQVYPDNQPEGCGPSGTAFRENRTYVCNDFTRDPATLSWRERAAASGFRSSIALPVRQGGEVKGTLTVYAAESDFFGDQEVALLEEAACDLSFALDVFERDEQRRAAEQALHNSENRLQFLLTSTPAIIYAGRASGDYGATFVSENAAVVTGHAAREFVEDPGFWAAHLHPDDAAGAIAALARIFENGNLIREYRFRHKDGGYRWMLDESHLVRDTQGRPLEYVGFWLDITGRKQAEEALQASRTRLAEAERMAVKLQQEREVSEMKTRFIAVTSHEFRTPMAAALGSVDLLLHHFDQLPPGKRQELLARIDDSLRRMADMLDEILTLNRVDSGRLRVQLLELNLGEFVRDIMEEVRAADRDIHRFECHIVGDATRVVTDPNLLHHILSNLLSNAVRFSPPGRMVTVRLESGTQGFRLAVEDQGIGIPEADRHRIFEPFERGSNVGEIRGTGLGLNIVKRMTDLLGGHIALDSAADRGTCFALDFPQQSPSAQPNA
ncbi:MAG: PAS domain S-box protein [Opitutaceae bacterium]|nr:PAS domain S-box protein [Opitutaceae bacterium]